MNNLKRANSTLTGNPVRRELKNSITPDFAHLLPLMPVVYVTGGSAGSHAINMFIKEILEKLLVQAVVIHQTGDARQFADFESLTKHRLSLPKDLRERYVVKKFIDPSQVGYLMRKAALVVSRSGINTVSELFYLKKPALLIPLSHGQKGEQLRNAKFLQDIGLAEVLEEEKITPELLYNKITAMITHQNMYTIKKDEKTYDRFQQAAENIVSVIEKIAKKENR